MEAAHPTYKVRLEQGATVWTNTRESWLKARWVTGPGTQFAEDQDDPFADLQSDTTLQMGLYEIYIDAQHNTLSKIVEAKLLPRLLSQMMPLSQCICGTNGSGSRVYRVIGGTKALTRFES